MIRTSLFLTDELKHRAERAARARGTTLSEYVRKAVEQALESEEQQKDPLFADTAVAQDSGPPDMSEHHDRYLYEQGEGGVA